MLKTLKPNDNICVSEFVKVIFDGGKYYCKIFKLVVPLRSNVIEILTEINTNVLKINTQFCYSFISFCRPATKPASRPP